MTRTPDALHKELAAALHEKLIPWALHDGISRLVLAEPPFTRPPQVSLVPHSLPPLRITGPKHSYAFSTWQEVRMKVSRFPRFGFVLEGEADLRFAVPANARHNFPKLDKKDNGWVLSVPERAAFVIPPGIIYDKAIAHWWRPHPEQAFSRLLWLSIFPSGTTCHTCVTRGETHPPRPFLFLTDTKLLALAETLVEELRERGVRHETAAGALLAALLCRVERALENQLAANSQVMPLAAREVTIAEKNQEGNEAVFREACRYIETHLHERLGPVSTLVYN